MWMDGWICGYAEGDVYANACDCHCQCQCVVMLSFPLHKTLPSACFGFFFFSACALGSIMSASDRYYRLYSPPLLARPFPFEHLLFSAPACVYVIFLDFLLWSARYLCSHNAQLSKCSFCGVYEVLILQVLCSINIYSPPHITSFQATHSTPQVMAQISSSPSSVGFLAPFTDFVPIAFPPSASIAITPLPASLASKNSRSRFLPSCNAWADAAFAIWSIGPQRLRVCVTYAATARRRRAVK